MDKVPLTLFFTIHKYCSLLSNLLKSFVANNMCPDQTAPVPLGTVLSGFIVFAAMVKVFWCAFEYMQQM